MYHALQDIFEKVPWRRVIWNNFGAPKWIFILRLAAWERLYTKDRLTTWEICINQDCSLCSSEIETTSHLFFKCPYSAAIWENLLKQQGIRRSTLSWQDEFKWMASNYKGKNAGAHVFRMTVAGSVYQIWKERNQRIFQGNCKSTEAIIRIIIQEIFYRGNSQPKIMTQLQSLNFYHVQSFSQGEKLQEIESSNLLKLCLQYACIFL